jgi:hypothetical protein
LSKRSSNDSLRRFFVRVNTDASFRKEFLENPVLILKREGVNLEPDAKEQLMQLQKDLFEMIPAITKIPTGYEMILDSFTRKKELDTPLEREPDVFII